MRKNGRMLFTVRRRGGLPKKFPKRQENIFLLRRLVQISNSGKFERERDGVMRVRAGCVRGW